MITFIIPTKKEKHLWDTINSIHDNSHYPNEVLWYEDDGIGQRAIINKLAKQARYYIICKVDAHCSFGPDFDKILLEDLDEKTVIAPVVYPLDEQYNINHHNPMSNFIFDKELIMHHAPEKPGLVTTTMCMQGSFFMCYKKFFFDAQLCDESLGSWGHQAAELGIQTWTNGGRCLISKKTYYGHIFRHDEKDFPYKRNKVDIDATHGKMNDKYKNLEIGWLFEQFK